MSKIIFLFAFIGLIRCIVHDDNPCILQATYDGGSATSSFNFREDGTFEWINSSGLGIDSYEGTYRIKNDLITLNETGFDKVIQTKSLQILPNLPWNKTSSNNCVVQVNDNGRIVDSIHIFTVYIDKRNK